MKQIVLSLMVLINISGFSTIKLPKSKEFLFRSSSTGEIYAQIERFKVG